MAEQTFFVHRSQFTVVRKCPRCLGSGQGKTHPVCGLCGGQGRFRLSPVFASDLTAEDWNNLSTIEKDRAQRDLASLEARNRLAAIHAEKTSKDSKNESSQEFAKNEEAIVQVILDHFNKTGKLILPKRKRRAGHSSTADKHTRRIVALATLGDFFKRSAGFDEKWTPRKYR